MDVTRYSQHLPSQPLDRSATTPAGTADTGQEDAPLRVAIIDDHRTMADLLAFALAAETGFVFVGHAPTVSTGLDLVGRILPDVVLLDLNLPDGNGMWLAREISTLYPSVRIVILTAETDPSLVSRAAEAGACGYVAKTGGLAEVLEALRSARKGSMVVDNRLIAALGRPRSATTSAAPSLTSREIDVLQELAAGRDVTAAARRLGISPHTARGYVKTILTKLDCHSQLEAVVTAARLGLLRLHQAS
ncbi:response regulator transcription factor [Kineosporia sp. R_H_3]|uniref:response regulator n=1 Tax=Kineosporia sp. R_H_3 TaxID=1961848 RepID=UPI000B4AAB21|nr:response regulator transcription factor [Kineosporia sp. R_H_3]